jgi:hypothetical protein
MKLTASELAYVRAQGLHLTEKCDGCGKLLNQAARYTIAGKPEVYCSPACRDLAFFRDRLEARKHSSPGRCVNCGAKLEGKRRGALYCDGVCKKQAARKRGLMSAAGTQLSGTPVERNQQVTDARICR